MMDKVFLGRCETYRQADVDRMVEEMFDACGGVDKIFHPGEKIFLKANLLMKKKPEDAVTTHPAVVEAVARRLLAAGCQVVIGDSPGGPFTPVLLKSVYRTTGMEQVAEHLGCTLNYDVSTVTVPVEKGYIVKSLTLVRAMWEADGVVSLAKLKTHGMTVFTGAVKNMFGGIPGLIKAEYHFKMPDQQDFSHLLVDICQKINPRFSLLDGIVGMEGAGPSSGTPRPIRALVGGCNPHQVDWVGASLIGLDQDKAPTLRAAKERQLFPEKFEITGASLPDLKVSDFKIPIIRSVHFYRGKVPQWLARYLDNWLTPQPIFHHECCTGCAVCQKSCPPGVIQMKDGKPVADLSACIRCFCCQELCPQHAVEIKRSWLLKKILG
ncbi:DUF362 domain-containing protein [Dehalobacterium formicoaceticum]|uniref:DUF362 domain-containing protein n=1 Tax=Dehalobacterium formicoaceticum TaxID=51515 RepID=UPI000B7E85A3|nr:DUF362 domain-containing protein [Dehalobacterium formicoaceticum]